MTISTTTSFNPDILDITEEAFELAGLELRTGNDMRTARRSLNLLTLEWANEGINLWMIEEGSIAMVSGTKEYDVPLDVVSILDVTIRTDDGDAALQSDINIERISQSTYSNITTKLHTGRPTQYWYNRIGIQDTTAGSDTASQLVLWPVPDSATYTLVYWAIRRIADTGASGTNTMEIPDRFIPSMILGLAYKIAMKKNVARAGMLKGEYREAFELAKEEDRVKEDFRAVPDMDAY